MQLEDDAANDITTKRKREENDIYPLENDATRPEPSLNFNQPFIEPEAEPQSTGQPTPSAPDPEIAIEYEVVEITQRRPHIDPLVGGHQWLVTWNVGEPSWETRDSFVEKDEEGIEVVNEAWAAFEATHPYPKTRGRKKGSKGTRQKQPPPVTKPTPREEKKPKNEPTPLTPKQFLLLQKISERPMLSGLPPEETTLLPRAPIIPEPPRALPPSLSVLQPGHSPAILTPHFLQDRDTLMYQQTYHPRGILPPGTGSFQPGVRFENRL